MQLGLDCFIPTQERDECIKAIAKAFQRHPDFLEHHRREYQKNGRETLDVARTLGSREYGRSSTKEIKEAFQEWFEAQIRLSDWLWILEFINLFLDDYVRGLLQGRVRQADQFLADISFYEQEPEFVKEQKELLQLAVLQNNGKLSPQEMQHRLEEHAQKYAWLDMYIYDGEPFPKDYFERRLEEYRNGDPERQLKEREAEKERRKVIFQKTIGAADPALRNLILDIRELLFLKSDRIDMHTQATYLALPLLREVAQRIGVQQPKMMDLSYEEIVQGLEMGKADLMGFNRRKEGLVMMLLDGKAYRFSGKEAIAIRTAIPEQDYSHLSEVKGQMAYPGKVRGRAKVVESEFELDKVEKGDVLFSPMTNPNYTPIFRKVAAIITDEGGVLCHSAVISREMKIPCVMGVRIGTRVFKDGDMVEVDAEKGTVRKIKGKSI